MKKSFLEDLYATYNRREFVHPDPLEFLYHYDDLKDREIVALVASSLAYGRVAQILKSVSAVLGLMGASPHAFVVDSSKSKIEKSFANFRHRFTGGREFSRLLFGTREIISKYGSLGECFADKFDTGDQTIVPALSKFAQELAGNEKALKGLIPDPKMGSACKRLNLFLRWMVREDLVDPGGWKKISPSKLIIPLDTHMHRMGLMMRMTRRKSADLCTATELTEAFAAISPKDPVKYDFSLTRLGIRNDTEEKHKALANLCRIS